MAKRTFFCGSAEHPVSRRGFLGTLGGAAAVGSPMMALDVLKQPAMAEELKKKDRTERGGWAQMISASRAGDLGQRRVRSRHKMERSA